jgi:hypothetical protein
MERSHVTPAVPPVPTLNPMLRSTITRCLIRQVVNAATTSGHLEAPLDRLSRWNRASTSLILSSPIQHAPLRRAVLTAASQDDSRT